MFDPEMDAIVRRGAFSTNMRTGLRKTFQLFYQPLSILQTKKGPPLRALMRWQHPNVVWCPLDFIPLQKRWGLIVQLGEWH